MAKRRDQIKMTAGEIERFLDTSRVISISTNGADGWPHVTALWYVMRDGEPWIYTYAKSQKVKNLERDSRATLLVESGFEYQELRGVMMKATAELHRDLETVRPMAEELFRRYSGHSGAIGDEMTETLRRQAEKRVAIRFAVEQTVSWDHAKLGGAY
jgi:PPOX class probable F420-dependent enzyme